MAYLFHMYRTLEIEKNYHKYNNVINCTNVQATYIRMHKSAAFSTSKNNEINTSALCKNLLKNTSH